MAPRKMQDATAFMQSSRFLQYFRVEGFLAELGVRGRPREIKITVKIGVAKIGQNYLFFFNEGFPADVPQSCAAFVSLAWLFRKIEVALLLVSLQNDQFG